MRQGRGNVQLFKTHDGFRFSKILICTRVQTYLSGVFQLQISHGFKDPEVKSLKV